MDGYIDQIGKVWNPKSLLVVLSKKFQPKHQFKPTARAIDQLAIPEYTTMEIGSHNQDITFVFEGKRVYMAGAPEGADNCKAASEALGAKGYRGFQQLGPSQAITCITIATSGSVRDLRLEYLPFPFKTPLNEEICDSFSPYPPSKPWRVVVVSDADENTKSRQFRQLRELLPNRTQVHEYSLGGKGSKLHTRPRGIPNPQSPAEKAKAAAKRADVDAKRLEDKAKHEVWKATQGANQEIAKQRQKPKNKWRRL